MAFNDVAEPIGRLTDPAERTESILGQPFSNPASVLDWVSPSHIVNESLKQVVGYDVFGEAAKLFSGVWELVWQAAGAPEACLQAPVEEPDSGRDEPGLDDRLPGEPG
jgi:hypothetical protein